MNTTKLLLTFLALFVYLSLFAAVVFVEKPKIKLDFLDKKSLNKFFLKKNTTKKNVKLSCPTQDIVLKDRWNKTIKLKSVNNDCDGCYCNCVVEENRNNITVRKKSDTQIYICNSRNKFRRRIFEIDHLIKDKKLKTVKREIRRNRLKYIPIERIPKTKFNKTIITKKNITKTIKDKKTRPIINRTFLNESTKLILTKKKLSGGK